MAKKTNITINDNKYFRVRAKIGSDENGKDIIKAFYGESKTEAENKRDAFMNGIKRGLSIDFDKITFGEKFNDWLNVVIRPNISLSSYERYEATYRLAIKKSDFFNTPLIAVKSLDLQKFYNQQHELKGPYRVERIHGLIYGFYKYCVQEGLVIKNYAEGLKLPKIKKDNTEKQFLTDEDLKKLTAAFENDSSLLVFIFAIYTGLRQGEIFALTHNDIDFEKKTITVNKSFKRVTVIGEDKVDDESDDKVKNKKRTSQLVLNNTKNQSSIRVIPMAEKLVEPIKNKIKEEKEKHLKLGIPFKKGKALLFTSNKCTPLRNDHVGTKWKNVLAELDIPYLKFHGLRHTFCTLLAKQGVPLKTASMLMGHSDINTTAQIYVHVDQEQKQKAINDLNNIVF